MKTKNTIRTDEQLRDDARVLRRQDDAEAATLKGTLKATTKDVVVYVRGQIDHAVEQAQKTQQDAARAMATGVNGTVASAAKWNVGTAVQDEHAAEFWKRALGEADVAEKDGYPPQVALKDGILLALKDAEERLLGGRYTPNSTCFWSNAVTLAQGQGAVAFRERAKGLLAAFDAFASAK